MRTLVLGCVLAAMLSRPAMASPEVEQVVAAFLQAYAAGDKAVVISTLDSNIEIDSGASSQAIKGIQGASDKLDEDQEKWNGSAHFGAIWRVSAARKGMLESIAFDVPLTIGRGAPATMHCQMIWAFEPDGWKLLRWRSQPMTGAQ